MKNMDVLYRNDTYNDIKNRFDRLIKIFNSDVSESQKMYEFSKYYLIYYTMISDFEFLKSYSKKSCFTEEKENQIKEIINFLKKSSLNTMSHYRYISENLDYYECYKYSKYIISNFIDNKDVGLFEYCDSMGIYYKDFLFCVNDIEQLDVCLYEKLQCALNERKDIINKEKLNRINLMLYGIKNGETKDGTKFDKAEFLKINPFRYDHNCIDAIKNFMFENEYDNRDILCMNYYIAKNNIRNNLVKYKFDFCDIIGFKTIIDGKTYTEDDNIIIYNYMVENDYPQISAVFSCLRERYVKGELNTDISNKKKVLLIPNN